MASTSESLNSLKPAPTTDDKIKETNALLDLYDAAIEHQKTYIEKVKKGKINYAQISSEILYALAKGELNLLERKRMDISLDIDILKVKQKKEDEDEGVENSLF